MSNIFNKKITELLGKMDERVVQAKLNAALDMLKKGDAEELAKKINKMDKNELLSKIDDFDKQKLKEMNVNTDEIKNKITEADLQKLSNLIGERGDEVVKKIKDIIK
jgi:ADP-dependent phosphofructokinase/glucokinase